MIFSTILLVDPVFAGATIVVWTGITLIVVGIFNVFLSIQLNKVKNSTKRISKKLRDKFEYIVDEIKDELYD